LQIPPERNARSLSGAAMTMEHKAFAFDWIKFECELLRTVVKSLVKNDRQLLECFVDSQRDKLTDPYEGNSLSRSWRDQLQVGDVQELADFAITKYYRPSDDIGLGSKWTCIADVLAVAPRKALLGECVGPQERVFDPGRMGSYFQSPLQLNKSFLVLKETHFLELSGYCNALEECTARQLGLYVTF
jgi:hypothetical protein